MMKRFLLLLITCLSVFFVSAQSTKKIKELESQRNQLREQIAKSETILKSTNKDVKSQLANLALINGQIIERKKYVSLMEENLKELGNDLFKLQKQLNVLQMDLKDKKDKYEASVKYLYRNKSIQDKLLFILSADNFSQTYRRLRYVNEYANYQRVQAKEIEKRQVQVNAKKAEVESVREEKSKLLRQGEEEKARLEIQEKDRQVILGSLKKKQNSIQTEINKKKRTAQKLNAQIDRLIEIEIEKARKRAEEEARRKAAEEARRAEALREKEKESSKSTAKKSTKSVEKRKTEKAKPLEIFNMNDNDRHLSSNFERNKGILPVPVTGPYVIVSHYGQYGVDGLKNVVLDNKGIDIKGQRGAKARAIFEGEVSAVFQYNGLSNVLIRHGQYISVYCNLSSVSVSRGNRVGTRDVIGNISTDSSGNTILHFQLRKETSKLNPETWLGR